MKIDRHVKPTKLECVLNLAALPSADVCCQEPPDKAVWHLGLCGTYLIAAELEVPLGQCHMLCLQPTLSPAVGSSSPANELLFGFGPQFCHTLQTRSDVG